MPKQNLLDLSITHVRLKDHDLLEQHGNGGSRPQGSRLTAHGYEDGFVVSTSGLAVARTEGKADEYLADLRAFGFSEEFTDLLLHAEKEGCDAIRLDTDGDLEPGLPYFEWSRNGEDVKYDADGEEVAGPRP